MSTYALIVATVVAPHAQRIPNGQANRQPMFPLDMVPATFNVTGIDGRSVSVSARNLSKLPRRLAPITDHGTAELDSTFMERAVLVVAKPDGKPLPETDGLLESAMPGDKSAGRWVRQVRELESRRAN